MILRYLAMAGTAFFLFRGRPGAPLSAVIKREGNVADRSSAENKAGVGKEEPDCASLQECAEEIRRAFSGAEQITGKWLNCDISRFVARAHFVPFGSSTASVYVRRMYMYMESLQDARAEEVRLFCASGREGHPALACVSIGRARDLAAAPGEERETGKEGFDGDDQREAGTG
jgi:hypothetical protein